MTLKVLAAIGQASYGELLRISLEREGLVKMDLVQNGAAALAQFAKQPYGIFLLDAEIKDQPLFATIQNVHHQSATAKIIVILGEEKDAGGFRILPGVDTVYVKPFHIQDMVRRVNQIARESSETVQSAREDQTAFVETIDTSWIDDREVIQENLFRLAFRSPAQAVFIFRENKLWVQASHIDAELNQIATDQFIRAWDKRSTMDLVRYFKDKEGIMTWMLYATILVKQYILAMVFPGVSLLHEVHGEVIRMANGLSDRSLFDLQSRDETDFLRDVRENAERLERDRGSRPSSKGTKRKTGQLKNKPERSLRFVLTPRDAATSIQGDIADSLNIWMPQICDTQHWDLIDLDIQPNRLQVTLGMDPHLDHDSIAAFLRTKTTEMIFKLFPLQKIKGDFWNEVVLITDAEKELPAYALSGRAPEGDPAENGKG